jgi:hypothetical protein
MKPLVKMAGRWQRTSELEAALMHFLCGNLGLTDEGDGVIVRSVRQFQLCVISHGVGGRL